MQKHFSKLASKDGNEEDIDEDNKTFVSELLSKPEVEINGGPNGRIGALIKGLIENDKVRKLFHFIFPVCPLAFLSPFSKQ